MSLLINVNGMEIEMEKCLFKYNYMIAENVTNLIYSKVTLLLVIMIT